MNIEDYLEQIQSSESMGAGASISAGHAFGMDSFSTGRRKKMVRRGIYPKRIKEQHKLTNGTLRAMIDFDGTIHKFSKGYHDGTLYDKPFEDAIEIIDWLKDLGFQIVIFTSRASKTSGEEFGQDYKKEIIKVENYLKEYGIHFDLITAEKLAANFYIDDLAIHFNNWESVKDEITKRMNL
jgi:hypothetical protein